MTKPKYSTVAKAWESYQNEVMKSGLSLETIDRIKVGFYGGAAATALIIINNDFSCKRAHIIFDECIDFAKKMVAAMTEKAIRP